MKPIHIVVGVSLLANLALGLGFILEERELSSPAAIPPATAATVTIPRDVAARAAAVSALVDAAKKNDAAAVRDQLRALGFGDDVVRSVVRAIVMRPLVALQRSITESQRHSNPYQQMPYGMFSFNQLTKEQRQQLHDLSRDSTKELEALLGPDPYDVNANRLSYLPPEKAEKLTALERDYSDLRSQVMADANGFPLPADQDKLAFLDQEKRKDLAALLTPEELAEYDLRTSPTAEKIRMQLRDFNVTPEEFKTIYAAEQAFDARYAHGPGNDPQGYAQARQQMDEQLRASLGPDRYQAYLRAQNPEYQALEAAAKRFDLPDTKVTQVFNTRDQTITEAQRISNDSALTPEQRQQALSDLANQTRNLIRSTLGPDIGDAYLKNNLRWLDAMQRGQTISVTPNGTVLTRPPPPPMPHLSYGSPNG